MGLIATEESTNPALKAARDYSAGQVRRAEQATLEGVASKTLLLLVLTTVAGAIAYAFVPPSGYALWISSLASCVVCLGVAFSLAGNPSASPTLAPLYALVEGVFLGVFTRVLDDMLRSAGLSAAGGGSVALPALVTTISAVASMLILYRARVIRPSRKAVAVICTLVFAVAIAYLLNAVLVLVFDAHLPFLSLKGAMAGGTAAWIGLALNVAILILASVCLVIDFAEIEEIVAAGSPAELEWYGGFCLLVTIAWIYFEAAKLAFRVAIARE